MFHQRHFNRHLCLHFHQHLCHQQLFLEKLQQQLFLNLQELNLQYLSLLDLNHQEIPVQDHQPLRHRLREFAPTLMKLSCGKPSRLPISCKFFYWLSQIGTAHVVLMIFLSVNMAREVIVSEAKLKWISQRLTKSRHTFVLVSQWTTFMEWDCPLGTRHSEFSCHSSFN